MKKFVQLIKIEFMEKFLEYCKVYLYFACGGFGIDIFSDLAKDDYYRFFMVFACILLMGGVYFIAQNKNKFVLLRCLLFYISAALIMTNFVYLLLRDDIFAYKECFQRILFSLWFISPPAVIDLLAKENWK